MTPPRLRRTPVIIIALGLCLIALAGCGLQPSARVVEPVGPALSGSQIPQHVVAPARVAAPAPVASFEVQTANLSFVEQTITVAAPGRYRVRLVNHDDVAHEIVFDDGTHIPAAAGETVSAVVDIPASGSAFLCIDPAHRAAGMVGQVYVAQ